MEENIFNSQGFNLSPEDIQLLAEASVVSYQDTSSLPGYRAITPELPGLSDNDNLIQGNSYNKTGDIEVEITDTFGRVVQTVPVYGDANATVYQSNIQPPGEPKTLVLAFRGTELEGDPFIGDPFYWTKLPEFYELFTELFNSLDSYIQQNDVSKVLVTGHSLGAAMTEIYMENKISEGNSGVDYQAVAIASPTASRIVNDEYNSRVLNIGYQNDIVYSVRLDKFVNTANATGGIRIVLDSERTDVPVIQNHDQRSYAYTVERIAESKYFDQMSRDSFIVIDRANSEISPSLYNNGATRRDIFILGEEENDILLGSEGNDTIEGSKGNDVLIGDQITANNDLLDGGEGDDILDGSGGEDTAVFNDNFENYEYFIDPDTEVITFTHTEGTETDGSDTLTNVELAQFSDRLIPLPLEDGPEDTEEADIFNLDGERQGVASLTLPTYTYDRNADYTFTLSSAEDSILYNLAFIIDVSESMAFDYSNGEIIGENDKLINAKAAYTSLTNFLTEEGIASQFAVIPFSDSASLIGPQDASGTIATINGLSVINRTNFNAPLQEAISFFSGANSNATNIAYFLSDGRANEGLDTFPISAGQLQNVADVRAFGIGNADIGQLNIVDSGNAVLLADSSDLEEEFTTTSGFNRDDIERVDIILDTNIDDNVEGNLIQTIQPEDLVDSPLGLQFSDSLEGLDVAVDAENLVRAEVFFNDDRPNTIVDFIVTAGQGIGSPTEGDDDIRMGATEREIDALGGNDRVLGNRLANTIAGGSGNDEIIGSDGDDTIIPGEGDDLIDGGEGIDTVVYSGTQEAEGGIRQIGEIIEVGGNTDTLINVEFVQFADGRVDTSDLFIVPIIEVSDTTIAEGNDGTTTATVNFNLSTPASNEVRFNYETLDDSAIALTDYRATSGEIIIAPGETSATVDVEIISDTEIKSNETLGLVLSELSGATFADNKTEATVFVEIENDDETTTEPPEPPELPEPSLEDAIDLSNSESQSVTITVSRSAAFNNTVDFYEINADGSVTTADGSTIAIGEAGYRDAAIAQRVGLDLTSPDGQSTEYTAELEGDKIYAPLLVANDDFSELTDEDTSNDPNVFFPYAEANIDNFDHTRSSGNLTFEFEDLLNGGANPDFDDVIVEVSGLDIEPGIGEVTTESVFGTSDDDVIEVTGSSQQIFAEGGNDTIDASAGEGGNRIEAGSGDDTVILGAGDRLFGGEGDDSFFATSGGSNVITGGAGADEFWIADTEIPESSNIITDFTGSEDIIGISGLGIGFDNLSISQTGDNTVIATEEDNLAILQSVEAASLSSADFAFTS